MNVFENVWRRSGPMGGLADHPKVAYFSSDEFKRRSALNGPECVDDTKRGLMFMLRTVALDPREEGFIRAMLTQGHIALSFFGVVSMFGRVTVARDSEEHLQFKEAIEANLSSQMVKAAKMSLRMRERIGERYLGETRFGYENPFYNALPWPTAEDFKRDRESAKISQEACGDAWRAHKEKLLNRRLERKAAVKRKTCHYASFYDLLTDLADHTFSTP